MATAAPDKLCHKNTLFLKNLRDISLLQCAPATDGVAELLETDMKTKALIIGGIAAVAVLAGGWALAQTAGHGPGGFGPGGFGPGGMHGMRGQMGPGANGMRGPRGQGMFGGQMGPGMQGEAGPGMRGQMEPGMMHHRGGNTNSGIAGMGPGTMGMGHDPATRSQLGDIHALLINHDRIKRTVTNLPDGIRTVTESDDPQIAAVIKTHVTEMGQRVKTAMIPACRSKARRYTPFSGTRTRSRPAMRRPRLVSSLPRPQATRTRSLRFRSMLQR